MTLLTKKYKRLHEGTLRCEIQQQHQVLLDPSRLWPQWFRIKTSLSSFHMPVTRRCWRVFGGGGDLKEMESCFTNMAAVIVICCFLLSNHTRHLLEKQMSSKLALQVVAVDIFVTQIPQMLIPVIMKCGVIWSGWRSQDFQNRQIVKKKKKSAYVSFTIFSCESRTDLHVFNH